MNCSDVSCSGSMRIRASRSVRRPASQPPPGPRPLSRRSSAPAPSLSEPRSGPARASSGGIHWRRSSQPPKRIPHPQPGNLLCPWPLSRRGSAPEPSLSELRSGSARTPSGGTHWQRSSQPPRRIPHPQPGNLLYSGPGRRIRSGWKPARPPPAWQPIRIHSLAWRLRVRLQKQKRLQDGKKDDRRKRKRSLSTSPPADRFAPIALARPKYGPPG